MGTVQTWVKAVNVMRYVLMFNPTKRKMDQSALWTEAEKQVLRNIQQVAFPWELEALKKGKLLPQNIHWEDWSQLLMMMVYSEQMRQAGTCQTL